MVVQRPGKRLRGEDVTEEFLGGVTSGSFLTVTLKSGKEVKSKGWPWVQAAVRSVLGREKVDKASFLRDGSLLLKTKNSSQTEKLVQTTTLIGETCECVRDPKLNISKGTIHAYDLQELSEDELVQWLSDFGVVGAKRFTKTVDGGRVLPTPTVLLTFDMPTCPQKLELDYVTYHVKKHVPNPLMCFHCGEYGHPAVKCRNAKRCLKCGGAVHGGECTTKCLSCDSTEHTCRSRECPKWIKEKDICIIKVEQEVTYAEARSRYNASHKPPTLQRFSEVVRLTSSGDRQGETELKEKVEKLERKLDEMTNLILNTNQQVTMLMNLVEVRKEHDADEIAEVTTNREGEKEGMGVGETSKDKGQCQVTRAQKETKQDEWKEVKGKRNKARESKDNAVDHDMIDTDDNLSQSQPIVRKSRSIERTNPRTPLPKKSWKEKV